MALDGDKNIIKIIRSVEDISWSQLIIPGMLIRSVSSEILDATTAEAALVELHAKGLKANIVPQGRGKERDFIIRVENDDAFRATFPGVRINQELASISTREPFSEGRLSYPVGRSEPLKFNLSRESTQEILEKLGFSSKEDDSPGKGR